MKAILRWLSKVLGSALCIILVIVFFPYLSRLAAKLLPDESGAAIKATIVLSSKLENSSRLETLKVEDDCALNYGIQASFLGEVANISLRYRYSASFGIDLSKVDMQIDGSSVIFYLPAPEVIHDSVVLQDIHEDDFWYPGFSKMDLQNLLEAEREARRNSYLAGDQYSQLLEASRAAFEATISTWLQEANTSLSFRCEMAAPVHTP